jgi:hypothetical protein
MVPIIRKFRGINRVRSITKASILDTLGISDVILVWIGLSGTILTSRLAELSGSRNYLPYMPKRCRPWFKSWYDAN